MTPFTTSPSAPVFGKTKFADINACMAYLKSQPKLVTRIGRAALGRILTMLLYLLHLRPLLIETVDDTIEAVFGYLADPDYVNPGFCDNDIFGILKIEIDKSVARSAKAREAAARRKAIREAALETATETAPTIIPTTTTPPHPTSTPVTLPTSTPVTDSLPEPTPISEESASPAALPEEAPEEVLEETSEPKPAKKRSDPDTVVSSYRPTKKPLPRYRVLSDEELNAEPYDPFGAHKAYLIQCRPPTRRHGW